MNLLKRHLLALLGIIIGMLYYFFPISELNDDLFFFGVIVILFALISFWRSSKENKLNKHWLRPSILFLVGFLAVNFQYIIDYYLGIKTQLSTDIYYPIVFNHCLLLGLIGLVAFVLGYSWKIEPFSNFKINWLSGDAINVNMRWLVFLQLIMFLLFLGTINITEFITGSYYGNEEERTNTIFEGTFYTVNVILIAAIAKKNKNITGVIGYIKSIPLISIIVLIIYMILRLMSGDRGPFIYTSLLLFFGYLYATRIKISLAKVLTIIVVGATFMSVVGIARQQDLSKSFSERIVSSYDIFSSEGRFHNKDSKTIIPLTDELGFSFIVNQTDVNAVEIHGESNFHPMYFVYSILYAFPFAPSFIKNTLNVKPEEMTSGAFTNYQYFGSHEKSWSLGTTIVADFYLQLGILGVFLGLLFTGCIMRKVDNFIFVEEKEDVGIVIIFFILLFSAKSIYLPRYILLADWVFFVRGIIILLVLNFLSRKNKFS